MKLMGSGHTAAVARGTSYLLRYFLFQRYDRRDRILKFLEDLAKNFETKKDEIIAGL